MWPTQHTTVTTNREDRRSSSGQAEKGAGWPREEEEDGHEVGLARRARGRRSHSTLTTATTNAGRRRGKRKAASMAADQAEVFSRNGW